MPFSNFTHDTFEVLTLPQLSPAGAWQTELSHDRAQDLLIWISRGQGRVLVDGTHHSFCAHHVIFVPAGTLWSMQCGPHTFGSCLTLPTGVRSHILNRPVVRRIGELSEHSHISTLFEQIQREQRSQRKGWEAALASLATVLQIQIDRNLPEGHHNSPVSAARRLSRAYCARVVEFFEQSTTMAEHAEALQVTPTHLTRVCKAETGKTAATLLTERQLFSARSLLTYSDAPIQDIASQLGFGSPAYFTRFISQHTGETPSRLRKLSRLAA